MKAGGTTDEVGQDLQAELSGAALEPCRTATRSCSGTPHKYTNPSTLCYPPATDRSLFL